MEDSHTSNYTSSSFLPQETEMQGGKEGAHITINTGETLISSCVHTQAKGMEPTERRQKELECLDMGKKVFSVTSHAKVVKIYGAPPYL